MDMIEKVIAALSKSAVWTSDKSVALIHMHKTEIVA